MSLLDKMKAAYAAAAANGQNTIQTQPEVVKNAENEPISGKKINDETFFPKTEPKKPVTAADLLAKLKNKKSPHVFSQSQPFPPEPPTANQPITSILAAATALSPIPSPLAVDLTTATPPPPQKTNPTITAPCAKCQSLKFWLDGYLKFHCFTCLKPPPAAARRVLLLNAPPPPAIPYLTDAFSGDIYDPDDPSDEWVSRQLPDGRWAYRRRTSLHDPLLPKFGEETPEEWEAAQAALFATQAEQQTIRREPSRPIHAPLGCKLWYLLAGGKVVDSLKGKQVPKYFTYEGPGGGHWWPVEQPKPAQTYRDEYEYAGYQANQRAPVADSGEEIDIPF